MFVVVGSLVVRPVFRVYSVGKSKTEADMIAIMIGIEIEILF